jgi:hypothetical protein
MHNDETEELARRFQYHPPTTEKARSDHEFMRSVFREAADHAVNTLPKKAGRELALCLTKIEEAMMWANAGIARHNGSEGGQ